MSVCHKMIVFRCESGILFPMITALLEMSARGVVRLPRDWLEKYPAKEINVSETPEGYLRVTPVVRTSEKHP